MRCASTWARTRDLSVNSRALCQLSHGGVPNVLKQVLPGFEPGSLDSKSRVITITLQNPTTIEKGGHGGARTHDPGLIRPMLYHLSYTTITIRKPRLELGTSCV